MKIAILGGSFDPPHIGHILIAQQIKEILQMDQVWLLPNYKHAFSKIQSPVKNRVEMTKLLSDKDIMFSDFEIQQKKTSYTIDTLNSLQKKYPEHNFFWILGSDQLKFFQKYKNWREIIKNHYLIIFPRETILRELDKKIKESLELKSIPKNIITLLKEDLILTNISSSLIRSRVNKGRSIKYLVPKKIEEYIKKNKLYK